MLKTRFGFNFAEKFFKMRTVLPFQNLSRLSLAFLFLVVSALTFAQEGFRAEVVTSEGDPVMGALVSEINGKWNGITDENGYATIRDVKPGTYIVSVKAEGFEEVVKQILTKSIAAPEIHFVLSFEVMSMPQIDVVESRNGLFKNTPGSISVLDAKTLNNINPVSGNEAFRQIPGVHAVDEEGMGMRVNIGIRGLDPDRSRSVLILEDGVPIALGPYGEPEMYYTPAIERMDGIEVLKGSGSILHGPQTIGGVVNYVTKAPPTKEMISANLRTGSGGLKSGMLSYGNTFENTGVRLDVFHKRADSIGVSEFQLTDVTGKLRFKTGVRSTVGVKFSFYDEVSNSTYVGMSQSMYEMGGMDFARIAPDDELKVRRAALSATHNFLFTPNTKLKTTVFANTTSRNWRRQDFEYNELDSNGMVSNYPVDFTGVIWGDTTIADGAIMMRNATGNRNRQFEVAGAQTNLIHNYKIGERDNHFTVGARVLYERVFEQRVNGTNPKLSSGDLRNEEVRTGLGSSFFAHNQFKITNRFSVTAGIRTEIFDFERDIFRDKFKDTSIVNTSRVTEVIPGAGFNYTLFDNTVLFGGMHRGFAPPRVKDAIASDGEDLELDAELSWNYELGYRTQIARGVNIEMTGFYMDFSNQVIPVSQSSGGAGTGLVNGGRTVHAGVETSFSFAIHDFINMKKEKLFVDVNYTYVHAEFSEDRFVDQDMNVRGNRTPYAPEHLFNGGLTYESRHGFGARISWSHVSEQFTDIANSIEASPNGRAGKIDAFTVFDATVMYNVKRWKTSFTLSAKNFTNERYIVSRRPQGIRVGNPRLYTIGVRWQL